MTFQVNLRAFNYYLYFMPKAGMEWRNAFHK